MLPHFFPLSTLHHYFLNLKLDADDYLLVRYVPLTNVPRHATRVWASEQQARIRLTMGPGGHLSHRVVPPMTMLGGRPPATSADFANFTSIYLKVFRRVLAIQAGYVLTQGRFTGFTMADLDSIVAELRYDGE